MHNARRVREGTVTITGSHPHSRWSFCAQGHRILSPYQASYPAILDIATSLSLKKLLGLRVGKSSHAFCDLARKTHRGAHHERTRAPYPAWPSSSRAAHAVPPYPLRRCVAPPQCLCSLGSVRRRGPSDLGGGILREHCCQRGARRHDATSRGAPPWGAGAGGRLGIQRPPRDCVSGTSGRPIAGHLHGTDCSVLPTPAEPRPAGLGETLLSSLGAPPGTAVYHHAAPRTGDARLGYPVCARPYSCTVPRQPPGFYGTGSRYRVAPPHAARRTATGAPALSLYGDWGRAEPVRPAHDSGPGADGIEWGDCSRCRMPL